MNFNFSAVIKATVREGSQLQHCGMGQSLSQIAFALSTVRGTFWGNGTKVKGDKEPKLCCSCVWRNTGVRVRRPQRPEGTTCTARQMSLTEHGVTDSDVEEPKGSRKWAGSASPADPYSAVCSHILHNPAKSWHCESPLNKWPSNPRLARVRCD